MNFYHAHCVIGLWVKNTQYFIFILDVVYLVCVFIENPAGFSTQEHNYCALPELKKTKNPPHSFKWTPSIAMTVCFNLIMF